MEYSFETILLCMAASHLIMLAIVWHFMKKTIVSNDIEALKSSIIELQKQVLKNSDSLLNNSRLTHDLIQDIRIRDEHITYVKECVDGLMREHHLIHKRLSSIEDVYNEQVLMHKPMQPNEKTVKPPPPAPKRMPNQKPIVTPR